MSNNPSSAVTSFVQSLQDDAFICVITLGEINSGIALLQEGNKRRMLQRWYDGLCVEYAARLIQIDSNISHVCGELTARRAKAGRPLHAADGLIAAAARVTNSILVTRNVEDFFGIEIEIVNPWKA
jgi:toxin FitB